MANLGKIHTGDVNTDFQLLVQDTDINDVNTAVDLATTTARDIIFTKPETGIEVTKTASILNPPGTDGVIHFVNSDVAFINEVGLWYYRAKLTLSGGGIFQSNAIEFEVLGSIV